MPKIASTVRMFAPELWGEVDRFEALWSSTYVFGERDQRATTGVRAHFMKCQRLKALAEKMRPNLQIDHDELEKQGFTPAENAAELATVIEAAILELYASVDCAVKVLRAISGANTRGFKDSTRSLFQNVRELQGAFPEALKPVVTNASWFWRLLHMRDELTHLTPGSVHLTPDTGKVSYHHYGLKIKEKPLIIEDIFGFLEEMMAQVNSFLGTVFRHLNGTLADKPIIQFCGLVEGRILHCHLRPTGAITFDSGNCGSWTWFELPENPTCPFKDNCGAYRNKAPGQNLNTKPNSQS